MNMHRREKNTHDKKELIALKEHYNNNKRKYNWQLRKKNLF